MTEGGDGMARGPRKRGPDVPLTVLGVRVELPEQHHVVLLLNPEGDTMLPLWVGAPEAAAAALALDAAPTPRPLTHELLVSVLAALGQTLERVRLTEVRDDVVHAELHLSGGATVDARASDAVVLALRAEAPVLCDPAVLAEAGMDARGQEAGDEGELDDFRHFLDSVRPEDFG
ncbi:bifunctional nuclease family protein [Micrococcus sp. NPDC078436]|uniref:bifunctional nuclease family protein n=1 Tax=Micrococcus sp. NPDC078436 TaxID=3154960 RepID=UPI00344C9EFE